MNQIYQINPNGVASENFGDETVVINLFSGRYYSLTDTSMFVWNCFLNPISVASISDAIEKKYNVEGFDFTDELLLFINSLVDEHLLVQTDSLTESVVEFTAQEKQLYRPLVLKTYTDMEQLILLDPVHDVNETLGWPEKK